MYGYGDLGDVILEVFPAICEMWHFWEVFPAIWTRRPRGSGVVWFGEFVLLGSELGFGLRWQEQDFSSDILEILGAPMGLYWQSPWTFLVHDLDLRQYIEVAPLCVWALSGGCLKVKGRFFSREMRPEVDGELSRVFLCENFCGGTVWWCFFSWGDDGEKDGEWVGNGVIGL